MLLVTHCRLTTLLLPLRANTQANIEAQIAATEAVYLDETHTTGNVLKGFESYLKPPGTHHRRRADAEEERLFSGSSVVSCG